MGIAWAHMANGLDENTGNSGIGRRIGKARRREERLNVRTE